MSHKNVLSKCLIKISHQNVSSKCLIRLSHQNFSSKCLIKMTHLNVSSKYCCGDKIKTMHSQSEREFDLTEKNFQHSLGQNHSSRRRQTIWNWSVRQGPKQNLPKIRDRPCHVLSPARLLEPANHPISNNRAGAGNGRKFRKEQSVGVEDCTVIQPINHKLMSLFQVS